jgi:hypothetical protein
MPLHVRFPRPSALPSEGLVENALTVTASLYSLRASVSLAAVLQDALDV